MTENDIPLQYQSQRHLKSFRSSTKLLTTHHDQQEFALYAAIKKFKVNKIILEFTQKLKKNITSSKPVQFEFQQSQQRIDQRRFFTAKGFNFPEWFKLMVFSLNILFSIVILLISTFHTLLMDFFLNYSQNIVILILKGIVTFIFSLRIIIYILNVRYQTDRTVQYIFDLVVQKFRHKNFLVSLFCLIMVSLSFQLRDNLPFEIVFIFSGIIKMFELGQDIDYIELRLLSSARRYSIWNLGKVLLFNIVFAHIMVIVLLAIRHIDDEKNWIVVKLQSSGLISQDRPWLQLYFWAYYWACTIMMTVGFGDISAVTYQQAIIIAFIQIFSVLVLAYNINFIGNVVGAMLKPKQQLARKLGVIHRMIQNNPISRQLQGKIQTYLLRQIQMKQQFQYEEHREIIQNLPQQLRNEYYQQANQIVFQHLPFFWHLQSDTLLKISLALHGKVYYPSQYFIKRSLSPIDSVIIVRSGTLNFQYFKPNSKLNGQIVQSIEIQSPQKPFQITNFMNRFFKINFDIVAQTYCYALSIKRNALKDILRQSNLDYYCYSSMMDKHERDLSFYYYTKCQYCSIEKSQQFHTKFECPKLHYVYEKKTVVYKHLFYDSKYVQRKKLSRMRIQNHLYHKRANQYAQIQGQNTILKAILNTFYMMWDLDEVHYYPNYFKSFNATQWVNLSLKKQKQSTATKLMKKRNYEQMTHHQKIQPRRKNRLSSINLTQQHMI